jgi:hypothetical protein
VVAQQRDGALGPVDRFQQCRVGLPPVHQWLDESASLHGPAGHTVSERDRPMNVAPSIAQLIPEVRRNLPGYGVVAPPRIWGRGSVTARSFAGARDWIISDDS